MTCAMLFPLEKTRVSRQTVVMSQSRKKKLKAEAKVMEIKLLSHMILSLGDSSNSLLLLTSQYEEEIDADLQVMKLDFALCS